MHLPEILNTGFKSDEPRLWALNIPTETISISELKNNLDIPYLESEETTLWNLSPRMLLSNFDKEITHAKRVEGVDLAYPIHIYFNKGQWIILDGVHRFTKALFLGHKTIDVKRVSPEDAQETKRVGTHG